MGEPKASLLDELSAANATERFAAFAVLPVVGRFH
jgi:hypothetical protein